MSAAALEVVREIYDAFARRDGAAILARLHADVEFHQTELLPWGGRYRGHDGVREFFERLPERHRFRRHRRALHRRG